MVCKVCDIDKECSEFNIRSTGKYRSECKDCRKKYMKEYRKNSTDITKYTISKGQIETHKICNTCEEKKPIVDFVKSKRVCKKCKSIYLKEYYNINKEKISLNSKEYYLKNSESKKKHNRDYSKRNRDKINKWSRSYNKERRKDPLVFLIERVGNTIRRAIKSKNMRKNFKTEAALGCNIDFFKKHIEEQFIDGMNWSNRDEWDLDHVIPISFAQSETEIMMLSNYRNLRPMWKMENILKKNHIDTNNTIYLEIIEYRSLIF